VIYKKKKQLQKAIDPIIIMEKNHYLTERVTYYLYKRFKILKSNPLSKVTKIVCMDLISKRTVYAPLF
jgi:hypothetical protein